MSDRKNQGLSEAEVEDAFKYLSEMERIELAGYDVGRLLNLIRSVNNTQREIALLTAKNITKELTAEDFGSAFEALGKNDEILESLLLSLSSRRKSNE